MSVGTVNRTCTVKALNTMGWSGAGVQCTGMQTRHTQTKQTNPRSLASGLLRK